jgi:membrane fusion protein, multidrug efflux system
MAHRQRQIGLRLAGAGLLLMLATAAGVGTFAQHASHTARDVTAAAPSTPAVPATAMIVTRRNVPIYTTGLGTVEAYNNVLIRSRVDGTLMRVPVHEGQEVKQGDLIAVIDPRPYQAALDQAMAKQQQDQAQLANARLNLGRYQSLAREDYASRQQLDTQQALVAQLIAAIAGDRAAIEAAQLNLSYCFITAPVPGRVGLRLVDPGNLVHATDTTGIITLTQIHPIAATFTLPQEELPRVTAAMAKGPVPVLAYASDNQSRIDTGRLLTPNNQIDQSTGTITLKAEFANPHETLWPGQFIDAHLQLGIEPDVVAVPPAAIEHGPDGLYVYLVKQGDIAAVQPITVSYQTAQLAVVASGLKGGEEVVVGGQSRLDPGTRVAISRLPATS